MTRTGGTQKPVRPKPKGQAVTIYKCRDLKAAIAREIRSHITDKTLRGRLIDKLSGEVAYGTGGGGGGKGVA
jgi:hypothetical protein